VRLKRLRKAAQALEEALGEGRAVSQELLQVSGLLERGIDPKKIRSTYSDLPRLIQTAQALEARFLADQPPDPIRSFRRVEV
jgi:HPt (histidine-containing phosphotransfer) domain-containing protein